MKTLHPGVHGGILARRDKPEHLAELEEHGLGTIDIIVGGLYPFQETVAREDVTLEDALENIDIGGPTMLRAAAKNFPHVLPIVDPADYNDLLDALRNDSTPHRVAPQAGGEDVPARRVVRHGHRVVPARRRGPVPGRS